jgi:hypothetical protein
VIRPTRTIKNDLGQTSAQRDLGMHYLELGQVTVILAQPDFSLARVVRNCGDPVEVGDIMLPFQRTDFPTLPRPRQFSPLMQATGDVKGTVVVTRQALVNFGSVLEGSGKIPGIRSGHLEPVSKGVGHEGTILYLSVGQGQGVRPGDLFIVYKDFTLDDSLYDLPSETKKLRGVRTAIGEVVILKVEDRASTALVTYASDGISQGDSVERR